MIGQTGRRLRFAPLTGNELWQWAPTLERSFFR
jgi:hypothetical protein